MKNVYKYYLTSLVCSIVSLYSLGETIDVTLTVNEREIITTPMQRKDLNGQICALLKVKVPIEGCKFEGNIIASDFDVNEYRVFLSPGSKCLNIKIPKHETIVVNFNSFGIISLKEKTVYELRVKGITNQDVKLYDGNIRKPRPSSKFKCIIKNGLDSTPIPYVWISYEKQKAENLIKWDTRPDGSRVPSLNYFRGDTGVRFSDSNGEATFKKIYKGEVLKFSRPGFKVHYMTYDSLSNCFEVTLTPEKKQPRRIINFALNPAHLSIGCLKGDSLYSFNKQEWAKLPKNQKNLFDSKWIVINKDGRRFLLSMKREEKRSWIDHMMSEYSDLMPSSEDMRYIMENIRDINAALKTFGGNKAVIATAEKNREIWFGRDEYTKDNSYRPEVGVFLDGYMHIDYYGTEKETRLILHF